MSMQRMNDVRRDLNRGYAGGDDVKGLTQVLTTLACFALMDPSIFPFVSAVRFGCSAGHSVSPTRSLVAS